MTLDRYWFTHGSYVQLYQPDIKNEPQLIQIWALRHVCTVSGDNTEWFANSPEEEDKEQDKEQDPDQIQE